MAKYCGKCGGPLDPNTGRCPKCDGTLIQQRSHAPSPAPVPTPKQSLNNKEKKRTKKATMSFGQKVKRFFKRLLIVVLVLAILTGSCAVALVVLDAKGNSFVQNLLGWIGLKENDAESVDNDHFASISGQFTDAKITNADEAIQAAQNAASQLGLQTATDELSLLNEHTVGELTYYRLQQNYQGIPVYGKTIVVVADNNGDAKSITSNVVDVGNLATNINYKTLDLIPVVSDYLCSTGFKDVTDITVKEIERKDQTVYLNSESNGVLAAVIHIGFKHLYGQTESSLLVDLENQKVLFNTNKINSDVVKCYGPTQNDGSFNGLKFNENNEIKHYMKDVDRNIFIYDAQGNTYWNAEPYGDGSVSRNIPQRVISEDEFFGNDEEKEESYSKGFSFLKALSFSYDYFKNTFLDLGIGTIIGIYDDQISGYNGRNAGGGIMNIVDITNDNLPDFKDPNVNKRFDGQSGIIILGTQFSENITDSLGVIFHEYTHFITRKNVDWAENTEEENQIGAINEGYSDIFGEIIESYYFNNEPDWENAGRKMHDPASNGYADTVSSKKNGTEDYEHGHSTVVSHAAYLMYANSGKGRSLDMGRLAKLWYNTMLILPSNCSYCLLRQYMEMTAESLNYTSEEKERISTAFEAVGIKSIDSDARKYDTNSQVKIFDKNGLAYDDYTIVIDGKEFSGWFKWGWVKKDYHHEIVVNSTDPYELNLPKGDYSITIIDNFSGNNTYSKSIKARDNQTLKDIEFATAFGFDYSVTVNPELQVQDINDTPYDNYSVSITGERESGTAFRKTFNVHSSEPEKLELDTGRYGFLLTDNEDDSKTKSFSVRVRADAKTGRLRIKTRFGKPYGEYEKTDLPSGAKEYNGHYYYVYDMPGITSWDAAKEFCRAKNGYLATLTSAEENTFVRKLVTELGFENAYFGLYDSGYNEWKWITNEHVDYTNWASGEPSSNSEHYGMFYNNPAGMWNDGDFGSYTSDDRAFICEWGSFEIADEDVPETPTGRTTSDKRDIVLVLDVSGSMSGDKLEQTKKASVNFINTILQEDASIGIVVYDSSAEQKADFSKNATHLTEVANGLGTGGNTNIEDGLVKAVNMLDYSNAEKQIIVLMSDGEPNCGKIGDELIDYAQTIKDSGTIIYTLGFFGNYSGQSAAQTLMERIASDGCHYEVSDADNLRFFFGDIADTINGQQYIYIRIACPVDVSVTYNGETLNSEVDNLSTRTSFGSLSFEENEKKDSTDGDDRVKVLRLKDDDKYDVQIVGNGTGRMNYTIGFMDETGEYSDFRTFSNIRINRRTVIDTVAENTKNTVLNVDEDGDGRYDLKYKAGENERGKLVDYTYLIYIAAAVAALIVVLIVVFKIKKAIKNKEGI